MTSRVTQQVAEFCQEHSLIAKKDRIVVGVSGGPDSLCLLHVLVGLKAEFELNLTMAHLNHQLRGREAQADENYVRKIATDWHLPIRVETHDVAILATDRKQSVEETARQIRYAFLWRVASEVRADKIAVGHHADDQVETILMHFLRGTGLTGLRGMLPRIDIAGLRLNPNDISSAMPRSSPQLIRPLLEISRKEIEAYCQEHNLTPRQDYSNQDLTLFRNRLRHELIPYLETYNPNIRQGIQNTAKVVAADLEILHNYLNKAWRAVIKEETSERIEIDLLSWLNLPLAMKRSTLRQAIQRLRCSLRDVSFEHIDAAIAVIEKGGTGTRAMLPQGLMVSIGYHSFTVAPEDSAPYSQPDVPKLRAGPIVPLRFPGLTPLPETNWQIKSELLTPSALNLEHLSQVGPWEVYLDANAVGQTPVLRTRQPGDIFCPLGLGGHSKKVNQFMINEKIPADWRSHIPLLVTNNQILWICGYRPDERARVRATTQRILHLKFEQTYAPYKNHL